MEVGESVTLWVPGRPGRLDMFVLGCSIGVGEYITLMVRGLEDILLVGSSELVKRGEKGSLK